MKTAIVWIEYTAENKPSPIESHEWATIGNGCEYETLKDFLDAIKKLSRQTGYHLTIKNVVIG